MTLRSAGRVWSVGLGLLFLWNTGDADLLTDLVSAESLRCCRLLCEVCRASGGCVVVVALIRVLPELSRDGWCVVAWGSTVRFRFCAGDRSPAGLLTSASKPFTYPLKRSLNLSPFHTVQTIGLPMKCDKVSAKLRKVVKWYGIVWYGKCSTLRQVLAAIES